jgi:predicted HAD superfamily phosphohydrolase
MSTATIETVTKMLESFPQSVQDRAVEYLREYLDEISDEILWDTKFERKSDKLIGAAKAAREKFKTGQTEPLDLERL